MTTVAYDGSYMAADTLMLDAWGAKETCGDKIWVGAYALIGQAGNHGLVTKWLRTLPWDVKLADLIHDGYTPFVKDTNDPSLLLVDRARGQLYRHSSGAFIRLAAKQWAVGSGRDYAIAAMHLGKTAK